MESRPVESPDALETVPLATHRARWTAVTIVELLVATAAVLANLTVLTFVLLAMAATSLALRLERWTALGFHRAGRSLVWKMFVFAAAWSVVQLAITMPLATHLSGREQDLSDFDGLQGNLGMLVALLLLSWTIAAVGEEIAYRGYLQTRLRQLLGSTAPGLVAAVVLSSLLFGIAHTEQGVIGMLVVTLDGVAFSVVRYRFKTLWASVLAHGFNNTIGFVAFFLVGPIHGLW